MESTQKIQSGAPDLEFREDSIAYMSNINRQMQNEIGEQTRRGGADTYDRTRKQKKGARYDDKGRNHIR